MPGDVILGPGDTYYDVSDVSGGIDFTGPCWQAAPLKPNGDFKKICGESGQTEPCIATVTLTNGEVWKFTFVCTTDPAYQGYVEKAGGSTGTYHLHRWATKQRISP